MFLGKSRNICDNFKLCQKLGKSVDKMFQMIKQVYGEEALRHSAVFKWHKRFAQGRDSFKVIEHTAQPRTVRIELMIQEVTSLMHANCSQTIHEITAAAAGISCGTCHKIPSDDLHMSQLPGTVFHVS
jgi:hypothetical protein